MHDLYTLSRYSNNKEHIHSIVQPIGCSPARHQAPSANTRDPWLAFRATRDHWAAVCYPKMIGVAKRTENPPEWLHCICLISSTGRAPFCVLQWEDKIISLFLIILQLIYLQHQVTTEPRCSMLMLTCLATDPAVNKHTTSPHNYLVQNLIYCHISEPEQLCRIYIDLGCSIAVFDVDKVSLYVFLHFYLFHKKSHVKDQITSL